jgi:4-amino-4-deoxy-L-arabinose transferase-like glycosyltransferase
VRYATFGLALCCRLAFQWGGVGMQAPPRDDAVQYDASAWSLAREGVFVADDGYRSRRAPAFPFLLAGLYRVFGHRLEVARIAQAAIGAFTCVIVLSLGSRLMGPWVGLTGAAACAVLPYTIFWSAYLLTEPLCALLVTASTLTLVRARASRRWAAVWAFVCALAVLTRPNVAPVFALGLVWLASHAADRVGRSAVALGVFLLALVPWTARNYAVHQRLVAVTTMGGVVLWEANNPYVARDPELRGRALHAPDLPEAQRALGLREAEIDAFYFRLAVRYMADHLAEMPRLLASKFLRVWNLFPQLESPLQRGVASFSLAGTFLLFAVGVGIAWSRKESWLMPLLLPSLAVTISALIYWGDARMRAPADPTIVLLASYGAWPLCQRLRGPRQHDPQQDHQGKGGTGEDRPEDRPGPHQRRQG